MVKWEVWTIIFYLFLYVVLLLLGNHTGSNLPKLWKTFCHKSCIIFLPDLIFFRTRIPVMDYTAISIASSMFCFPHMQIIMQTGNAEKWFLEDYVGSNWFLHWIRSSLSGRVMSHLLLYLQLLAQHLAHSKNSTNNWRNRWTSKGASSGKGRSTSTSLLLDNDTI